MDTPNTVSEYGIPLTESSETRITVICMCLFFFFLIALSQGLRYGRMAGRRSWSSVLEALVLLQCFICVAFVASVAILEAGLSMTNSTQCHAAIRLCIALYACGKVALYLFFNERIHVLRAPFMSRLHDPIWILGMFTIIVGFGGVQAYASVAPMASFDGSTGYCEIGIAADASICVIVFDSVIGGILTGVFVKILWPAVRSEKAESMESSGSGNGNGSQFRWMKAIKRNSHADTRCSCAKTTTRSSSRRQFKAMLWRNVLGSATVLANTIINNTIFLTWDHSHKSEVCLLTCMTDIVWGMLVTSWLTMGSAESTSQTRPRKSQQLSDSSTLVSFPTPQLAMTPWEKHWSSHTINKRVDIKSGGSQTAAIPLDIRSLGVIPEPEDENFDGLQPLKV